MKREKKKEKKRMTKLGWKKLKVKRRYEKKMKEMKKYKIK